MILAAKHVTSSRRISTLRALSNDLFHTIGFTGTGKQILLDVLVVEL